MHRYGLQSQSNLTIIITETNGHIHCKNHRKLTWFVKHQLGKREDSMWAILANSSGDNTILWEDQGYLWGRNQIRLVV